MDKNKKIDTIRTQGNKRLYNLNKYIRENSNFFIEEQKTKKICYCRVSTINQKGDLERQINFLQEKYPGHEIISDIGSGINFKRKGIKTILELSNCGLLEEVVVAYRDRLCRIGYDLFEWLFKQNGTKLIVVNDTDRTPDQELTDDLIQIIHVFSARSYG